MLCQRCVPDAQQHQGRGREFHTFLMFSFSLYGEYCANQKLEDESWTYVR